MKFNVIDLFCGAGGFARGFVETGFFNIVLAIDNMEPIARTFKLNFPNTIVLCEDIKNINQRVLENLLPTNRIDVVIGSPPCEPFTAANPRRKPNPLDRLYADPIGQLVLHYIRIVDYIRPKVFIMENVPHIIEGELKNALRKEFKRIGYPKIFFNILRAEDYGTPSHRLRVFISNIPIRPKRVKKRITVQEALQDLPPPTPNIPNHDPVPVSPKKLRRISRLKWGQALVRFYGFKGRLYPNLIRLHPHKIAPTVLGCSRFIHPYEGRFLTVREQARLMGFPDDHVFLGGRDIQFNQVGEAVPVPLSKAIAQVVYEKLKEIG